MGEIIGPDTQKFNWRASQEEIACLFAPSLDKLAELQGKKMYEVVECLINKEFDGLFDKKSNDITQ